MKKTLLPFSVTVILAIVVFFAIGLTGCEWFDTTILGKPSKTELAEREKKRQDEEAHLDSIRKAGVENLLALDSKKSDMSDTNQSSKAYHVIMGCYEDRVNIDNMIALLKHHGYNGYVVSMGGLTCVSAAGFDTEREAANEADKLMDKDGFYEEEDDGDIWVYKK